MERKKEEKEKVVKEKGRKEKVKVKAKARATTVMRTTAGLGIQMIGGGRIWRMMAGVTTSLAMNSPAPEVKAQ